MAINKPARHKVKNETSHHTFGWVMAALFAVISLFPLLYGEPFRPWAMALAAIFVLLVQVRPAWLQPLNQGWFYIGIGLSMVMVPLVFGVIYFCVVTPLGLLMRLAGTDPLRARGRGAGTYWVERTSGHGDMRRQF